VLSAAALPSHDLLLVTKGNITSIKVPSLGKVEASLVGRQLAVNGMEEDLQ